MSSRRPCSPSHPALGRRQVLCPSPNSLTTSVEPSLTGHEGEKGRIAAREGAISSERGRVDVVARSRRSLTASTGASAA